MHSVRSHNLSLKYQRFTSSDFKDIAVGGNVMCVCLYQKSVCKVNRTKGVYCRFIQYIRISVFAQSRRVHLFIVSCLIKNKFNIHYM